jgi:hypothetical protein
MDKPLEIGILHYSCPPVVGGVEEVVFSRSKNNTGMESINI